MSTIKCLFIIFSLCVLTTDAANTCVQRSELECPTPDGQFLHELCCNLYYKCTDSNAALMECPANEVFDRPSDQCVNVDSLPCVRNICGWDKLPCPAEDPNTSFVHPKCCNLYYKCSDGTSVLEMCPSDEVYDPIEKKCSKESTTIQCNTNKCSKINELPTCPTADPNTSFFHPKCCNLYYQCTDGTSVLDICPFGEVYDPIEKKCSAESAAVECKTNKCGLNGLPDPCPSGAYFKNPGCSPSYYQCVHGKAVLRPCAPRTWWNPDMTTCDHSWRTNELCVDF